MGLVRAQLSDRTRLYLTEPAARARLRSRALEPWWRLRFHRFGENAILDWPAWLYRPSQIAIGDNAMILGGCWLAVERAAWDKAAPVLSIGNRVGLRIGCTVSASDSIVIEDNVTIGAHCSLVDSDHTHVPHENVLDNPPLTAPIRIGRGTWLGDGVSVLRGANVGEHCTVGSNSVVRGEIPDHSVAVGVPARVVGSTN